ncbi:unnamed protein product [Durusdinium trenchii]|uniref:PX domain-containing protein n=1 Tax=Durusdinium trenchii TaxID=1381693 RepID=A0ABP0IQT7_9DINO
MAPGEGLSLAAPQKPEEVQVEDPCVVDEDPLPETPRSSFYTLIHFDLPKGVPGPPCFRTHARHVVNFDRFREAVEGSPKKLVALVRQSRQKRLKDLGWTR